MLAGQTIDALATSLEHLDLLYLGLNCATGPDFMTDHIRTVSELTRTFTACVPNAGLPDENGCYLETPETIARVLEALPSVRRVVIVCYVGSDPGALTSAARFDEYGERGAPQAVVHGRAV